jgi:Trp operon repressor
MEISLRDLFDIHFLQDMPQNHEEELVERVNEAIRSLEILGKPVGWSTLARTVGISRRLLERCVQVRAILAQYKDRMYQGKSLQFLQREESLVKLVQKAVSELEASGEVAQRKEICRIVGLKYKTLIRYPRVKAILDQCTVKQNSYRVKNRQEREQALVERVQVAMQMLEYKKAPMSQREVAKLVGLTLGTLHKYPRVRAILEEWSKDHHRFPKRRKEAPEDIAEKQGEELIERVPAAIRELVDLGETISQRSVCGILGISICKLHRYPGVRTVVNQYATEYRLREYQKLEDQLLERVQTSIRVFNSESRFVSKRAVLEAAGVSHHLLHRYPRISTLLDEYFKDRLSRQSRQKLQREEELVKRVQGAISELRAAAHE